MRKIFFYLFILKKVFLLRIYPLFERNGDFFDSVRKNIENYLIFQPSKLRAKRIQRDLLKKINPQRFINNEGIKLYAWFIKPQGDKPVFLHLHGQAESILSHQDVAMFCLNHGYGLFMLSYRGHYKSGGKASEQGVFNDAQAAILQLKKLGVESDKIIVWGHSLGTCAAIETAIKNEVAGVILQCPIKEIKSAAIDVYKFYCSRLHLSFLAKLAQRHIEKMNLIQNMDNISKIHKVKCPILLLHSKSDQIASFENSVKLAEQNSNAELFLTDRGSHWGVEWCLDKVFEFSKSLEYNKRVANN